MAALPANSTDGGFLAEVFVGAQRVPDNGLQPVYCSFDCLRWRRLYGFGRQNCFRQSEVHHKKVNPGYLPQKRKKKAQTVFFF
ncbi:hypothetical protein, partial [Pseudomonas savastanoi]|uniref:hypothetical protein n=1 Tax=Pseudomonas savastanoi TaxID=29438 RepID=UPI00217F77A7